MVDQTRFRAAIAHGFVKEAGGVKYQTDPAPDPLPADYLSLSNHGATVLEYRVGAETIARKVQTSVGEVFWLRADLAEMAECALAHEAQERERVIREVCEWRDRTDAENAKKRGLSLEAYRRLRNAQGHRQMMKSGINSRGM